jgi:hypothetical protein
MENERLKKLENILFEIYENIFDRLSKDKGYTLQEKEREVVRDFHRELVNILAKSSTYEAFREEYRRSKIQDRFFQRFIEIASSQENSDFFERYVLSTHDGSEEIYEEYVKPTYIA